MAEYFRCDSCKGIFPKEMGKEIQYEYNTYGSRAKTDLTTEEIYGRICLNCANIQPTKLDQPTKPKKTTQSKYSIK